MGRREAACLAYILDIVRERDMSAPFEALVATWRGYVEAGRRGHSVPASAWLLNSHLPVGRGIADGADYISAAAAALIVKGKADHLVRDELVPASVIRRMLFQECPASETALRSLLLERYRLALITTKEADRLREAGPAQRILKERWSERSLFIRYDRAGIDLQTSSLAAAAASRICHRPLGHARPHGLAGLQERLRNSAAALGVTW